MPRKLVILLVLGALAASAPLARAQTGQSQGTDALSPSQIENLLAQIASIIATLRVQVEYLALRLLTPKLPAEEPAATQAAPPSRTVPARTPPPASQSSAAPITSLQFTRVLNSGDSGDDVRAVQQRLADLGYLKPADVIGQVGLRTRQAAIEFQRANAALVGITEADFPRLSGRVGPDTIRALNSPNAVRRTTPSTQGDASQLDRILKSGTPVRTAGDDCPQFAPGTAQRAACDLLTGSQTR